MNNIDMDLLKGKPGTNGGNAYLYIAYASDAAGTDFSIVPDSSKKYLAFLQTKTSIVPSADYFADATWLKYLGTDGSKGDSGIQNLTELDISTGSPASIDATGTQRAYWIKGNVAGSGATRSIGFTGTPETNSQWHFKYTAEYADPATGILNIFGSNVPAAYLAKQLNITMMWNGSIWTLIVNPDHEQAGIINTNHITDSAITNAKLANKSIVLDGNTFELGSSYSSFSLDATNFTNIPLSQAFGTLAVSKGGLGSSFASSTGILKFVSGVASMATAGTDYSTSDSTETFTNKSLSLASGRGNYITDADTTIFASGIILENLGITISDHTTLASALAIKNYALSVAQGINWLENVDLATTANITLSGEQSIDGTTTSASRVLVKDQTTASENGIYTTDASSWTRVADLPAAGDGYGASVLVTGGSTNIGIRFIQIENPCVVGTSDMVWEQFSSATSYTASGGIKIVGNDIQIDTSTIGVTTTSTSTLTNKTITGAVIASLYTDAGKTKLLTFPTGLTDTLVSRTSTDNLSNKTFVNAIVSGYFDMAGNNLKFDTAGTAYAVSPSANELDVYINSNPQIKFLDGHVDPGAHETTNLGSATGKWGEIYFLYIPDTITVADAKKIQFGSASAYISGVTSTGRLDIVGTTIAVGGPVTFSNTATITGNLTANGSLNAITNVVSLSATWGFNSTTLSSLVDADLTIQNTFSGRKVIIQGVEFLNTAGTSNVEANEFNVVDKITIDGVDIVGVIDDFDDASADTLVDSETIKNYVDDSLLWEEDGSYASLVSPLPIDMQMETIESLERGEEPTDAVNYVQLDTRLDEYNLMVETDDAFRRQFCTVDQQGFIMNEATGLYPNGSDPVGNFTFIGMGSIPVYNSITGKMHIFFRCGENHVAGTRTSKSSTTSIAMPSSWPSTISITHTSTGFAIGTYVFIKYDADNYMIGVVTGLSSTQNDVSVLFQKGSGTYASWTTCNMNSAFFHHYSTDSGATWSHTVGVDPDIVPLLEDYYTYDVRNHNAFFIDDGTTYGTIVIIYDPYERIGTTSYKHTANKFIYSTDDGVTWSAPQSISLPTGYEYHANPMTNTVYELSDGYYAIPTQITDFDSPLTKKFGVYVWDNDTKTVTEQRYSEAIDCSDSTVFDFSEPALIKLANKTFIMLLRPQYNNPTDHKMYLRQYISYDDCVTWTEQGFCTFDYGVCAGSVSDYTLLPKPQLVNIFGHKVAALYYTNRTDGKLYVVYARLIDLIGPNGHLGWNANTKGTLFTFTTTRRADGNGCSVHPNGSFKGLFMCEDQLTSSSYAEMRTLNTLNNIEEVAIKLGIPRNFGEIYGSGSPAFTPHYIGQIYTDTSGNKLYFAVGVSSSSDWIAAN